MNGEDVKLLFGFNYWANHRILDTAAKVSPEQYAAPTELGLGYKSLRGTMIHLMEAEWSWRLRWETFLRAPLSKNASDDKDLTEADFPTLAALRDRWVEEESAMWAYLAARTDAEINGIIRYPLPSGGVRERVLWHSFVHLVNHGTQHRSEAAALLTMYNQSPGELDFNGFLNEHFHLPQS